MSKRVQSIVLHSEVEATLQQGRYPMLVRALGMKTRNIDLASIPFQRETIVLHEQTMAVTVREGFPVELIGAAPALSGMHVYRVQETDWVLMNLSSDPLYTQMRMPLPNSVKKELKAYVRAGLDFEAIYVAHEIEAGRLTAGQPLTPEMLMPPPRGFAKRAEMLSSASQGLWRMAAIVSIAAIGAAAATASAGSAPLAAAALTYDPILFGLHLDRSVSVNGRPLALWYYLTHWNW
jgi:hypothetical protein